MSILLRSWNRTVNGQCVTVRDGALFIQGERVGSVAEHPVNGYTVRLPEHRTIDVPDMVTAAKATIQVLLEDAMGEAA